MHTTFQEYIDDLNKSGIRTVVINNVLWADYREMKSAARQPFFNLSIPKPNEIKEAFKSLKPLILTYATQAENETTANGFLYISTNKDYNIEKLNTNGRRDARRALRSFTFEFLDWETLAAKGYEAYADTRSRNNISDSDINTFNKLIKTWSALRCSNCIAAIDIESKEVAGFLAFTHVGDWIEIYGSFSANRFMSNCTSNGLFHFIQEYYLKNGTVTDISYGYSSIQIGSKVDSLHHFKERIGFSAIPIKRHFLVNPNFKIFINPASMGLVNILLKVFPKNRAIRKVHGMFKILTK